MPSRGWIHVSASTAASKTRPPAAADKNRAHFPHSPICVLIGGAVGFADTAPAPSGRSRELTTMRSSRKIAAAFGGSFPVPIHKEVHRDPNCRTRPVHVL